MSNDDILEQVFDGMRKIVTPTTFNKFIKPTTIWKIVENPNIVYLQTESDFFLSLLKSRYLSAFEENFSRVLGQNYQVIIKTKDNYSDEPEVFVPDQTRKSMAYDIEMDFVKEKIFNPLYTFDNFVVGESNKFANAVSQAVAANPCNTYKLLYLYGNSGLGKTHLMNAIGIYLMDHHENLKILYVSTETFANELIEAIQKNKTKEFKNKYRSADVLLVDDIQFLEGKESTQEEFFHTFNTLYNNGKQMIISSDRPPIKLTKLEERLRNRFGWNMVAEIKEPDYETRVAILNKKAENHNIKVDEDVYEVICMIANNFKDNIRELEGAFNRVVSFSNLTNEPINLKFAKDVLTDLNTTGESAITPIKIKKAVATFYGITVDDLESSTRKNTIAYPRQIAMYLCRTMTDSSLPKIGEFFGDRHYSTVKHACDKIEDDLKTDELLENTIEEIKNNIM